MRSVKSPCLSSDKRLKRTLVVHGHTPEKKPFLEVHNPTDEAVEATVTSPPHPPLFGGFRREIEVPPGSSIHLTELAKP